MADLTWTATTDYSWIHISPDNGNGDAQIRITADKAPYTATTSELEGVVVISCTNCSSTIEKRISVTRCKKEEVTCNDRTTYEYSNGSVDKCGNWVMDGYEITTHYKDDGTGNCEPYGTPTSASTQDSGTTEENDKEYPRTISVKSSKFGTYELEQEAGPCGGCTGAETTYTYEDIKVSCHKHSSVDVPYTATTTYDNCEPVTGTGTSAYTINIDCNPNDENRDIQTSPFKITQLTGTDCCDCSCDDIQIGKESATVNVGSTVNVGVTANCTTDITVSSNNESVAKASYNNGIIAITGISSGNTTITINYKANGNGCPPKTISVGVGCPEITITKDKGTLDCSGGTVTFSATIR